ncbi:MAG TPA: DUF1287 domain-containing protein [Gemmatimonadales bacterium]|nr:DUF1287 domain-containing protein [Gemmatimonadales bacterium]
MHLVLFLLAPFLALGDRGIFPELADKVSTVVPAGVAAERTWTRTDPKRRLVTLYDGVDPVKVYRLEGDALAPGDAAELAKLVRPGAKALEGGPPRGEDTDGDGIVDRLDILIGAKKLLHLGARYIERYVSIPYPGGDVPRTEGVCSDTVIRALRNAGIDLQKEVHEDILRAPKAYPMVEKIDASINHRRVKTILPWFQRHFVTVAKGGRFLPGDIVFFDTFPSRPGPDHLGVVSDRASDKGLPYVINNWTDGATDAEMELLSWVPVTHHFRAR